MRFPTLAAIAPLLLGALPLTSAHAQSTSARDSVQVDAKFVRSGVSRNMLEVRLGEVAQHKATNKMVQGFAQRMVTEHQRLQKQWADLASKYGITVTDSLGSRGQQRVVHMQSIARPTFDKAYMTAMIKAHGEEADYLRTAMDSAHSDPVKKLLAYERPIVLDHLLGASSAGKEVGVDTMVVKESQKIAAGEGRYR
jgi:putative membrane protein